MKKKTTEHKIMITRRKSGSSIYYYLYFDNYYTGQFWKAIPSTTEDEFVVAKRKMFDYLDWSILNDTLMYKNPDAKRKYGKMVFYTIISENVLNNRKYELLKKEKLKEIEVRKSQINELFK